ncbi:MAG: hypothetical protein KDB03_01925 [Planctomycetales bacterium]|nr:hypothetical protein [Planctomycetales bacterium]
MRSAILWDQVLGPLTDRGRCQFASHLTQEDVVQLEKHVFQLSPRAIRLHPRILLEHLPFETLPVPWYTAGRLLKNSHIRPGSYLQYAAGDYYIQDASSMLALAACQIEPEMWVCDCCASPGGKATGIAEALAGTGLLVANEVITSRLELLNHALCRAGFGNHFITNYELEDLSKVCGAAFDRVLVDAPCSGQSMIVRGKQSLSAFSGEQMHHSSLRQQRILCAATRLVRPGGRLIYSTCTYAFIENEGAISQFLSTHPKWRHVTIPELNAWQSPLLEGCYRLWPHRDPCAGAFVAVLTHDGDELQETCPDEPQRPNKWMLHQPPSFSNLPWLEALSEGHWGTRRGVMHWFAPQIPSTWLPFAHSGIPIAELKSHSNNPLYGAATLTNTSFRARHSIDLDDMQASQFVGGMTIKLPTSSKQTSGWHAIHWQKRALGWGKVTDQILKNHFPKLLRQHGLSVGQST